MTEALELQLIIDEMSSFCSFSLGEKLLQETKPSFDPLVIKRDNKRIKEALAATISYGSMPMNGIKDITHSIISSTKGQCLTAIELLEVKCFLSGILDMFTYVKNIETEKEELSDLVYSMISYPKIIAEYNRVFNDYGDINDDASSELKSIRRSLRKVEEEIATTTERFVRDHSSQLMDSIVTTRNNRLVVLAKIGEKNSLGGFVHGESASGQTAYVEPFSFVALNNKKQSLVDGETEEIKKILWQCTALLVPISDSLLSNMETCALLDCLFAKALWGKKEDAIVAKLQDEFYLQLSKARHPCIDRNVVVCNTYRIGGDKKMLLITGPNTGGKTVSLKVIGLSVLMTYCGMPICCEEAIIPFFDACFLDIGDEQSVVQSLSTFSSSLVKLAKISKEASSKSLVLLDEIGSGTDPREGESLAIAFLNDCRRKGCFVVATTHYGRLKTYAKKHDDICIASVDFDLEKLMPTYRYREGFSGQSNAFDIARRFGLKESILVEAQQLKQQLKSTEDELIEKLEKQLIENHEKEEQLNQLLLENEQIKREVAEQLAQIDLKKSQLLQQAEKKAMDYVEEIMVEADCYLEELKSSKEPQHAIKRKIEQLIPEKPVVVPHKNFEVGDVVEYKMSNQLAIIRDIDRNRVTLDINGLKVQAKIKELRHTDKRPVPQPSKSRTVSFSPISSFSMECHLIGLRVDEALEVMAKYLDDAKMAQAPSVRIIHGDGTGALRKAVHEALKKDKSVAQFRLGSISEGLTGATVVTFKE